MYPDVQYSIGGAWGPGAERGPIRVLNPATEEAIGTVYEGSKVMRQAADLLQTRIENIAMLMTWKGKPLLKSPAEMAAAADIVDWFAEEARRTYGPVVPARAPGVQQLVVKEPVGPVAAFTPWNFPINQAARKISAALAVRYSVILKAPEETPAAPAELVRAYVDAGLPPGALNLVYGASEISSPAPGHSEHLHHGFDGGRQAAGIPGGRST